MRPASGLCPLLLAEPHFDDTMPDDERLIWAIQEAAGVEQVDLPYPVMVKLAGTLREFGFQVTVKGHVGRNRFSRAGHYRSPGIPGSTSAAIDIGTTTVSAVLAEMTTGKIVAKGSSGNGQIRYGADVINRIIEQGKPGGRKKLQDAIVKETSVPILANLYKAKLGISRQEHSPAVRRHNTTMNHLFVGVEAGSGPDGALYPFLRPGRACAAGDLKLPGQSSGPCADCPQYRLLCGRRYHRRCLCQPDLEQTGL
ncbi:MAG: hypothetical protein ACLU9S_13740 [Oscillospiraceae bacterium]